MTSPSESRSGPASGPLSQEFSYGRPQAGDGGVADLVFASVGTCDGDALGGDTPGPQEAALRAHIAALELELRAQATALVGQIEATRQHARSERQAELEVDFQEKLAAERNVIAGLAAEFAKDRSRYFAAVEMEVVKLALAIAARILHREAKMEPLLLAGAVRVALEKIEGRGETILRVPESDLEIWKLRFPMSHAGMTMVPDAALETGTCVLETPVGTVNFGVAIQLEEIERGFFDLLQHRPV